MQRHRLDRGGNRQLNCALYRIAITQARYHPPARAYLERKQAEGKSRREAIRCLKRQLARVVFNTLESEPRLDIGATLAQPSDGLPTSRRLRLPRASHATEHVQGRVP